ncbi:hypothetical protein [Microbacterium paraoxydans]|uniref:hypothetical protein n=1 Tax=Microbacterium paraoxydans TaxID=199592 RepID=UPI001CF9FE11|nr:hypothetical protein [Microbacterium paraoxydans]
MKRYGPLIVVADALAVGDPGRNHLRLTPEAVLIRAGVESRGIVPWARIEKVALDVPTTRFRLPGLVGTVLLGAVTAAMLSDPGIEPEDGAVTLTVDGESSTLPLSRHHVGGYWAPSVAGAHRLIEHLVDHPEQRALLEHPERLIDVAARLARGAG